MGKAVRSFESMSVCATTGSKYVADQNQDHRLGAWGFPWPFLFAWITVLRQALAAKSPFGALSSESRRVPFSPWRFSGFRGTDCLGKCLSPQLGI